jgi:hypothetical protein
MPLLRTRNPAPDAPLPTVEFDGVPRVLACLYQERLKSRLLAAPRWSAKQDVIPESKWQECSLAGFGVPILNQRSTNACVGHGTAGGFTTIWWASGFERIVFDPFFNYSQINGNRDAGAIVADAAHALESGGMLPRDDNPQKNMWWSRFPTSAKEKAKRFRAAEVLWTPTWQEKGSALQHGWVVVFGIMVGNNFGDLDGHGVAPLPGWGSGGHCLYNRGMKNVGGRWVLETPNSWGTSYGQNGVCYLTQRHYEDRDDAYAIRVLPPDPMADEGPGATEGDSGPMAHD